MPAILHFEVVETRRVTVMANSIDEASFVASQAFKNGQNGKSAIFDANGRAFFEFGETTSIIEIQSLKVQRTA